MSMNLVVVAGKSCLALPYLASSEEKAKQFADAIETVFVYGVKAEVFEDGGNWGVAVTEGMDQIGNPDENPYVLSAFALLLNYDLADSTGNMEVVGESLEELTANHKALTRRARRAFCIEDKLDAILTVLVGTEGAAALMEKAGHRLHDNPPRMSLTNKS